jgi:integrase
MPTVTLRKRKISGGRYSLSTDTYPSPNGKRFKSLRLYVEANPKSESKEQTKQTIALAKQICQRQSNELAKPEVYASLELQALNRAEMGNYSFRQFCKERIAKINNEGHWAYKTAVLYFFNSLGYEDVKCGSISQLIVDEFREYLPTAKKLRSSGTISQNSAATYMAAMKGLLNDAYMGGHLPESVGKLIKGLASTDSKRAIPTLDEIVILSNTECQYPLLREMALFSCMTGLRFSDCQKIVTSEELKNSGTGYYLDFTQKKRTIEAITPISDQAAEMLLSLGDKPFIDVDYNNMQRPLRAWIQASGIQKHITFHSFRHAYAALLLASGVDIFVVSKMLNHKTIRSTQVYTKVLDRQKEEASKKIILPL